MSLQKDFKNKVAAGALAFSVLATPFGAVAEDSAANTNTAATATAGANSTASTTSVKQTPFQLMRAAGQYSIDNDAVGMFINIAPGTRYTPQQVGEGLVKKFAQDGIQAAYTYNYASAGDSTISFFVRGIPYTGYGFGKAAEGYAVVSETIRALQTKDVASNSDVVASNASLAYNQD